MGGSHLQVYIKLSEWFRHVFKDESLPSVIFGSKKVARLWINFPICQYCVTERFGRLRAIFHSPVKIHMKGTFPCFCFFCGHCSNRMWHAGFMVHIQVVFLMKNKLEFGRWNYKSVRCSCKGTHELIGYKWYSCTIMVKLSFSLFKSGFFPLRCLCFYF